jgi:prolyl-tRNA editing enzyme YbaK/EbsC (Cys-tRNA(Pro) deacylase)
MDRGLPLLRRLRKPISWASLSRTNGRFRDVTDLSQPAIQRVIEVAARKGVALDIRVFRSSTYTAEETAATVGAEVGQIVKSLVFVSPRPEGRLIPIICLVSGRNQVDLQLLAAVAGEVSVRQATVRQAHDLTGFSVGGIPPFGHGREVRILMDQDLCQYQWVWASAGMDKIVFRVPPRTLQMLANAVVTPLAAAPWMQSSNSAAEPRLRFDTGMGA